MIFTMSAFGVAVGRSVGIGCSVAVGGASGTSATSAGADDAQTREKASQEGREDIYAHVMPTQRQDAADRMDEALTGR